MKEFNIPKYTEQVIPQSENLFKSIVLLGLLVSNFFLAQAGVNAIDTYFLDTLSPFYFVLKWGFIVGLALFNSVLILGLGILAHEGTHWVLFKSRFWNDFWGGILLAFVLLPYYDFREFHFTHHGHTHQPGIDPEEPMNNYPIWFALTGEPLFGLIIRYKILVTNLLSGSAKQRSQVLKDLFFLTIAGVFYFYLVPLAGISLWYTVVPTFLLMPLVFAVRNVSEHHAIPAQSKKISNQTEQLNIDSWMVLTNPVVAWLWSNINYHQVHHRYPYLSHRYLPEIFATTKDKQPYLVVKGYLRCLMYLRNRQYYGSYDDLQPFLTTKNATNS